MLTLADPRRLLRLLLSLVIRSHLPFRCIVLALRACFASFWRSIPTPFTFNRGQSQIRLHANDVPGTNVNPTEGHQQCSELAKGLEQHHPASGTLAALPIRSPARWKEELPEYQALVPADHRFRFDANPSTPEKASQRYKPRRLKPNDNLAYIPAGRLSLVSATALQLPDHWRRHVHPEGNVFFYHERLRIFTEIDITRASLSEFFFYATKLIQMALEIVDNGTLDEFTELVLNLNEKKEWCYYFVDHKNRLLFWVEQIVPRNVLVTGLQGITGYGHIKYLVEARYWSHCEYYPHERTLPKDVFQNLRGMLNYAKTDMMTADSSTSPFTQSELVAILDLVNSLKDDQMISDPHSIWAIARLMAYFTEAQFLNFCGQQCARLNADTALFGQQTWNRSLVFQAVNLFLLTSPNDHANRLQRIWVDGTIIQPRWEDFINRLTTELSRYPIFSTVMLAVNFSFLAVPGVTTPGTPATNIQIIIYCSTVSTIGSIVFSFVLANIYSDPGLVAAGSAADVMRSLSGTKWGMACLAITHSLPIACLVWSMTLFSVALALQIFGPKELATITTLSVECFILVLLGIVSYIVMGKFCADEGEDVEPFEESDPTPAKPPDLERGSGKANGN